ncbi:ABC transporter permease [Ornithinimicrobium sp. Y1847]|uniref:ABC transporter permease n=1 Tax=unclassified Ornithinimicrobium TaxID=2615080 RepID=UPI003B67CC26
MLRSFFALIGHDLRQQLRDSSLLIFGVAIPLALSFVFSLAFSGLDDVELEPVSVAVATPADDQAAQAIGEVLRSSSNPQFQVTVREVAADDVAGEVADETGGADVGVIVRDGFSEALGAGDGSAAATVQVTLGRDAGLSGEVVAGIVRSTVERMDGDAAAVAVATTSTTDGTIDPAVLGQELAQAQPEVEWSATEVSGRTLSLAGGIVAGQAGMFLFFTVGFVVLTLLTEREWGTLARLRSMPMPRWLLPVAKATVALLLGVASTTVVLVAGSFFLDGVDFGSWAVVLPLVVAVVAAATSVMFIILKVARTSEQASLAMSVVAISLGIGGGTFFRISTDGWIGQLLQINPVAALGRGLGITAGGGGLADLTPVLLTLLTFTVAVLIIARLMPGRKDAL